MTSFDSFSSIKTINVDQHLKEYLSLTEKIFNYHEGTKTNELRIYLENFTKSKSIHSYLLSLILCVYSIARPKNKSILNEVQNFITPTSATGIFQTIFANCGLPDMTSSVVTNSDFNIILISDNCEMLKELISKTPNFKFSDMIEIDGKSISLLDLAAFYGSVRCFKHLMMNDSPYTEYTCPLSIAGGNNEIIHLLESHFKDQNFENKSCFDISIAFHQYSLSDWLMSHFKHTVADISIAIRTFNYLGFIYLFQKETSKGLIPCLSSACKYSNVPIIQYLVEKQKADLANNGAPLYEHCACGHPNMEIIKYLVDHGAKADEGIKFKRTFDCGLAGTKWMLVEKTHVFAICAMDEPNFEYIKYLVEHGANVDKFNHRYLINERTIIERTPLFEVCAKENPKFELIRFLVEKGADVNKKESCDGNVDTEKTSLYALCMRKNPNIEIIKYLIEHGADINKTIKIVKNCNIFDKGAQKIMIERTLLYKLCSKKEPHFELIKLLIENGADIKTIENRRVIDFDWEKYPSGANVDNIRRTPLYALNMHNNLNFDIFKYFIEHGAEYKDALTLTVGMIEVTKEERQSLLYTLCLKPGISIDFFKLLVEHRVNLNKGKDELMADKTCIKETPLKRLRITYPEGNEVIDYLVKHGAKE